MQGGGKFTTPNNIVPPQAQAVESNNSVGQVAETATQKQIISPQKGPLMSIIVPCYNTERYLEQCVNSILEQTYSNWELWLIDDGSQDSTPQMCDNYADSDTRVNVVHKRNGGVSSARNTGLDKIKGKWIMFIDSDDWLEQNAIERVISLIDLFKSDVIGFNRYNNRGERQWKREAIVPSCFTRKGEEVEWFKIDTLFPDYDLQKNGIAVAAIRGVGGKVYRRSIIEDNDIRFEEDVKIAEDAMFNFDVFEESESITLCNEYLLHYRLHPSSVMRNFNASIVDINKKTLEGYYKRIKKMLDKEAYQIAFLGVASECIFRSMKLFYLHPHNHESLPKRIKSFRESVNDGLYKVALACPKIKDLPKGKREMIYCIRHNMMAGAFLIAWASMKYLSVSKKTI